MESEHTVRARAADAGTLAYRTLGSPGGSPAVICHGLGLDSENLMPLARLLARDRRVILWDMPGHGQSDFRPDMSIPGLLAALDQVLACAQVAGADLIGFSFGGILAQYAVVRDPRRFRSLVAYGCFAPFHQESPAPAAGQAALLGAYAETDWDRIREDFAASCASSARGRAEVQRALSNCSKPAFVATLKSLLESFQLAPDIRFDVPLLHLRGSEDINGENLAIAAERLSAASSAARVEIIPSAGHCAHDDDLAAVFAAIEGFLRPGRG